MLTNEQFIEIVQGAWEFFYTRLPGFVILVWWVVWASYLKKEFVRRLDLAGMAAAGPRQFVARSCTRWIQYCDGIVLVTLVSVVVLFIMYQAQRAIEKSVSPGTGANASAIELSAFWNGTISITELLLITQIVLFAGLSIYKFRSFWIADRVYRDMKASAIDCVV